MGQPFDECLEDMLIALFDGADPLVSLRKNAAKRGAASVGVDLEGEELDATLQAYVDKVSSEPAKMVDEDVEALRRAGLSTAEIFDVTVGAAVGASLAHLRLARKVIAGGES